MPHQDCSAFVKALLSLYHPEVQIRKAHKVGNTRVLLNQGIRAVVQMQATLKGLVFRG